MPAKLKPEAIKRVIHISGIEVPVILYLTDVGFEFGIKGSRIRPMMSWYKALKSAETPVNVPAHMHGKPYELLQHQAKHLVAKQAKKS